VLLLKEQSVKDLDYPMSQRMERLAKSAWEADRILVRPSGSNVA